MKPKPNTHGGTDANRLRLLERFLEHHMAEHLPSGSWADLGVGGTPTTTQSWAQLAARLTPETQVVGYDHHPSRVAFGRSLTEGQLELREGSFDLPRGDDPPFALIRAMNVLRSYPQEAVADLHQTLRDQLAPGGWLLEGTCGPQGHVLVAHVQHRGPVPRWGLLFATSFARGTSPHIFRDRLPKDLRYQTAEDGALHGLFTAWLAAWRTHAPSADDHASGFQATVAALAAQGWAVRDMGTDDTGAFMLWTPEGGVPAPAWFGRRPRQPTADSP